jgi:bacterial leucyl aminopeptidase
MTTIRGRGRRLACLVLALGTSVVGGADAAAREPASDRPIWITMPARELAEVREDLRAVAGDRLPTVLATEGDVALAATRESLLGDIASAIHERYHRCGGFMAHTTREHAERSLRAPKVPAEPLVPYTIDNPAAVNAILGQVTQANIPPVISQLASYWTRYYTTQTGLDAAVWLKSRWEQIGSGRPDVSIAFFDHPGWLQHSVIARINGATIPQEAVVLGAHLDSINGGQPASCNVTPPPSSCRAPGADDDASGVASLTEMFRAAMAAGYRPARTVFIMAYAAEEAGLLGSQEIATAMSVNNPYRSRQVVIGALQLDMTNYRSSAPNAVDVGIIADTDFTSPPQNAFVEDLMDTYLPTLTKDTVSACGYGCSDHASWTIEGVTAASFPFEARFGQHNPLIHSSGDTLVNSDPTGAHATKFARLAAAYMAELAKGTVPGAK